MRIILTIIILISIKAALFAQSSSNQAKGDVFFADKKYQEAIDSYTRAIDSDKIDTSVLAVVYFYRASSNEALKYYRYALLDYNSAISLNPSYREAYLKRGIMLENIYTNYQKSAADYYKAITLTEPNNLRDLSILYRNVATDEFQMGRIDSALKVVSRAIELNPPFSEAYESRAGIYTALKNYPGAIADFTKAINYYNNSDNEKLSTLYAERGDIKKLSKEYKDAINDYSFAIKENPDNKNAYWSRGAVYYIHGDYKLATADFTKTISFFMENEANVELSRLYDDKALSEIKDNLLDEAIKDDNKAITLNKWYGTAYVNLGNAYTKTGNYKDAIKEYLTSEQYTPGHPFTSYIYSLIAGDEYSLKKYRAVADYCDTAIMWDASCIKAYYYRAKFYLKKNQNDLATANFSKVISLDTSKKTSAYIFSLYYTGMGEDVINMLQKEISTTSDNSTLMEDYYSIARLYSLMNNPDEAVSHLKAAIDKGYSIKCAIQEEDFDNIRNTETYKDIIARKNK